MAFTPLTIGTQKGAPSVSFTPYQPTQKIETEPGSATLIPGSNLKDNLKALPRQLADLGKTVFNSLTGSEQGLGKAVTKTITAPAEIEAAKKAVEDQNTFIKTLLSEKKKAQELGQDVSHYDKILKNVKVGEYKDVEIPTSGEVLSDAAFTALDIATAGTFGAAKTAAMKTGELAVKGTPTVIDAGKKAIEVAKNAVTKTPEEIALKQTDKIAEAIAPKLTAREEAEALATRGGTKSGILRTIKANADPAVQRVAETVKEFVPEFNPKKSLVENITYTKDAVGRMAKELKEKVIEGGQDRIYSFKELTSALKSVEKPTLIAADTTLNRTYDLVIQKAMEIARSNGGKVSDLFQSRKEFDDFVSQQFPNLYSSETLTPMRSAIKQIRNAMTDFTAEHLPQEIGLRDSLTNQSRLLTAIENMSEKAASGAGKEVGTNVIERATSAARNHPIIGGFGGIAAYEAVKKIPIIGDILP